jgi:Icc-related predicted phosphoesterase
MKRLTRVLFISDVHGATPVFTKALGAAAAYKAQTLIHGGDIIGKYITPFFHTDGTVETEIMGAKRVLRNEGEVKGAEAEVSRIGSYAYHTTREQWKELLAKPGAMNDVFLRLADERLSSWVQLAEAKLKPLGIKLFLNIGNDDFQTLGKTIEASSYVVYPNSKVLQLDEDHELLSLGNTNITPWNCEGDMEESDLQQLLDTLASKLEHPERAIFNLHCPPVDTKLDIAPLLDAQLRPVYLPGGEPRMVHVGCKAVRSLIQRIQPMAGLHGHIHESRGYEKIGRTMCFNPGSEYTISVLSSLLLNLSRDKVESFMFLSA